MNNQTFSPSGNAAAYWQAISQDQVHVIRQLRQTLLKVENLLPHATKEALEVIKETIEATR